jgi:hypothetical protein
MTVYVNIVKIISECRFGLLIQIQNQNIRLVAIVGAVCHYIFLNVNALNIIKIVNASIVKMD